MSTILVNDNSNTYVSFKQSVQFIIDFIALELKNRFKNLTS